MFKMDVVTTLESILDILRYIKASKIYKELHYETKINKFLTAL